MRPWQWCGKHHHGVGKLVAKGRTTSETPQDKIDRSVHTSLYHPDRLPVCPAHFGVTTIYKVSPTNWSPKKRRSSVLYYIYIIRGVSQKYPTCVHISVSVLFFVIRTVASFEVVPIWLNHMLPAVLPHLKAVLERRFWNGLQLARHITLNRLDVVEPLSFERHFQFW